MTGVYFTKENIQKSIKDFLNNWEQEHSFYSERSIYEYKTRFTSLINNYNDSLSLKENMVGRLSVIKASIYFYHIKEAYSEWLKYSKINCDISDIRFTPKFINFRQLQNNIEMTEKEQLWRNVGFRSGSYFTVAKLYAYLLWIGLSKEEINNLRKRDYDIQNRVLTVGNDFVDLNKIYYQDNNCANIVHKELVKNITAVKLQNTDGLVEYIYGEGDINYSDHLLRTSTLSTHGKTIVNKVSDAASVCISPVKIIYKSGLYHRLYIWSLVKEKPINYSTLDSALEEVRSCLTSKTHIHKEYYNYIDLMEQPT